MRGKPIQERFEKLKINKKLGIIGQVMRGKPVQELFGKLKINKKIRSH